MLSCKSSKPQDSAMTLAHATSAVLPDIFDEDGFLHDPSLWNDELALQIADLDGISVLRKQHWTLIHHVREHTSGGHHE